MQCPYPFGALRIRSERRSGTVWQGVAGYFPAPYQHCRTNGNFRRRINIIRNGVEVHGVQVAVQVDYYAHRQTPHAL